MHTPGPWRADPRHTEKRGGLNHGFIISDSIVPLAAVVLGVEEMPEDEGRANTRLIAAAPDTQIMVQSAAGAIAKNGASSIYIGMLAHLGQVWTFGHHTKTPHLYVVLGFVSRPKPDEAR